MAESQGELEDILTFISRYSTVVGLSTARMRMRILQECIDIGKWCDFLFFQ